MIGKKINQLATELAPTTTDLTIIGDPISGVSKKITLEQLGAIFGGAVSFYTTLGDFPATGVIDIIYCAKDTKKLYLWSGSAYVEVFPSQSLLDTYQLRSEKGVSNGYASLDVNGKVPIGQLPNSIMEYKGTWSAATNTPTLANGTGDTGDVYICNAAGTVNFGAGPLTFAVGDYVVYSGTIWQRSSGAVGTVTSVAATITGDAIGITGSPVTTSGTLAFAFGGNSTQYINGAGNLVTFPGVINEAQNLITEVYNKTGATLTKGTVVYINGGQGNLPSVTKALATGDSTSAQTYGIVRNDITNNNNGYVVVAGRISDLDTQAYTEGTQLYLSPTTAGTYTSTKPYAPNHLVYVGIVVRAHPTQGVVEVKIQNGYELDELHNVAAQTPSNNDGLFWEASTSLWKNKSIATVLGYTPANAATYVPYTGATANVNLGTNDLLSRSVYIEGTASYQAGLLMKQISGFNFVTGAYTQVVPSGIYDLYVVHNQTNGTRRRYAISVASLQDGDDFQYLVPRKSGTFAMTSDIPSLTGYVQGTGTTNYLPKFTGTSTIGNSQIFDNGTNVGIGTASPSIKLSVNTNATGAIANFTDGIAQTLRITTGTGFAAIDNPSAGALTFQIASSERMRLDASGNLGLGVTPSAWVSSFKALQIGSVLGLWNVTNVVGFSNNIYNDGTASKYITSDFSTIFEHSSGQFRWLTAPSGTAGNAISFTQAMTLDASGRLSIGNTSVSAINERLNVTGNGIAIEDSDGGREMLLGHFGGADGILGTFTNDALQIRTNNTARLTIASTGAATFSSSVTATSLSVDNTSGNGSGRIQLYTGGTRFGYMGTGNWAIADGTTDYTIVSVGSLKFATNDSTSVSMLINSSGRVGIGTTSPAYKFQVQAASGINSEFRDTAGNALAINLNTGVVNFLATYEVTATNMDFAFTTTQSNGSQIERMRITSGGNVGIGTTSPSARLNLAGGDFRLNGVNANSRFIIYQDYSNSAVGVSLFNNSGTEVIAINGNAGNINCTGNITTGAPTNGTAQPWKLGNAVSGAISTDSYIIVSVNGTTYSIPALNGLP